VKIAILSLYSGHLDRGVETWTREISTRLRKLGNVVLVLQGGDESYAPNYKVQVVRLKILLEIPRDKGFIRQVLFSAYRFSLNLSFSLRALLPLIRFNPDVVLPSNGNVQSLIVGIAARVFRWKVVMVGHAGIGGHDKWNILTRPAVFVSPSNRGKRWSENLLYSRGVKVVSIPHGVDITKFSKNVNPVKLSLVHPRILCVSSMDPFKRIDLAIRAISELEEGSLLVIGGNKTQSRLDDLGKSLLGSRYLRLVVKPADMPGYYAAADVFTLPSTETEAFGIVYLEALASGLPVVATDDDLRHQIVDGAGYLVDPTDIKSYSDALKKAANKNWGEKPRLQAKKFSWDKIILQYDRLFKEIVGT